MNEPSVERPIARLRETATRIAPAREPAVLMDEVLAAATDPFFAAESPLGTVKVAAALAGERVEVPLDLSRATPFQRRVLGVVKGIARGEVRPYVWVASEAGAPGASRAVGNVMANNPVPLLVPCHRVVRNDGRTGSYAFGAGEKVRLLRLEGVEPEEISGSPYVATPTTGIVCHATCRNAKRIQPHNRRPFRSMRAAVEAGYRPCEVCRPVAAA